ncbi:hypothetical protein B2A_15658 [mine drainage metagenome]|uniref:Uncharacterized protein n=1 Tax=mine drainage metagenome TaxID=410659 RepID=T0Y354_9ZZZZ
MSRCKCSLSGLTGAWAVRTVPVHHHPLADAITPAQRDEFLANIRTLIGRAVEAMPDHARFVAEHCKAAVAA